MGELHNTHTNSACNYIAHALNVLGKLMNRRHTILNRMLIIIASIFALVALMGVASATEYYVKTNGDNSDNGLTIDTAWASIQYGFETLNAGDTLYIVDGTYHETPSMTEGACISGEHFTHNTNATHQITLTAYNGTPTIARWNSDCDVGIYLDANDDYINIDGISVAGNVSVGRFNYGILAKYGSSHVNITNCTIDYINIGIEAYEQCNYIRIENCTVTNGSWNMIMISNSEQTTPMHDISILNCTIGNGGHSGIDFVENITDVRMIGNTIYNVTDSAVYTHGTWGLNNHFYNFAFSDNEVTNCSIGVRSGGVQIGKFYNLMINNNTFTNIAGDSIDVSNSANNNNTICNNTCVGEMQMVLSGESLTARSNSMSGTGLYRIDYGNITVKDFSDGATTVWCSDWGDSNAEVLFTDGKVMTYTIYTQSYSGFYLNPIWYHPDKSNFSIGGPAGKKIATTVTTYNVTLRPTYAHLHDVTVDTWDEATNTYCLTASSTLRANPTWINLTTKAAYATYNITRDGILYDTITTGADGVLRYRYAGKWDVPRTFEFSYASDRGDPAPLVTNLRNDPPTQNTITLRWDCSTPDVDHYTIYQNGALLDTTGNNYYSATNLAPDTLYTFSVSATKDGITGEDATRSVRTAAEEGDDFGSNTVYIADDVTASPGQSVTVPIRIHNATGVACAGVNLTYDPSVVVVTGATEGDFITSFKFNEMRTADGWVIMNTYIEGTQLIGDVKIADVTFKAVGNVGATSPLVLDIISMANQSGYSVSGTVSNGLFTVVSDTSPPDVTSPFASQLIPDDTDGVPSWGETAVLEVTVTDESDIASVTIDLSAIGGSPVQPMTPIGSNVWSVTTSASAGTPPQTYDLTVCATDSYGHTNMYESVELVVMRNGDVTGDGDVSSEDVALLENYVTYSGQNTISSEFVADVTGDGMVNIADAMLLANRVTHPDQYTLR